MSLVLKAYVEGCLRPLAEEPFEDYRRARVRAAALLRAGLAGADTIAICAAAAGREYIIACLTRKEADAERATEWSGVWEWGMTVNAYEEAEAAWAP